LDYLKKFLSFAIAPMDFNNLLIHQRVTLLLNKGRLVASLPKQNRKINLYFMDGKYYAVYYNADADFIEAIEELQNGNLIPNHFQEH
jgi:hypothetical protein